MKRVVWLAAFVVLLATSSVLASTPGTVWFHDDFESYANNQRLRQCSTNWTDGFDLAGPENLIQTVAGNAYDGTKYVRLKGHSGTTVPSRAQTKYAWAAQTAGEVQILHVRLRRDAANLSPHDHAGIWLIDASNAPIMGWYGGTHRMRSQTTLATIPLVAPYTEAIVAGPEGADFAWNDLVYHDFDAVYHPDTGLVEFFVDGSLNASTTIATGLAGNKIYVRDYVSTAAGYSNFDYVLMDDLYFGTTARPAVTYPKGGALIADSTPEVTWTPATAETVTGYQVRICSADDADGPIVYDSGQLSGSATSHTTTVLPFSTQMWAFVNENHGGTWSGWSVIGNGGFTLIPPPGVPTITAPSGTVVGAKPSIVFTADAHDKVEAKITTASDGSGTPDWWSDIASVTANAISSSTMLTPGTQYYAFVKVGNDAGWSDWSAASAFQVTREGEGADVRHMDEKYDIGGGVMEDILNHDAPAPNDGLKVELLPMTFSYVVLTLPRQCSANNTYWNIEDQQPVIKSETMRLHKVLDLSLDKGVTLVTAMRIPWEAGEYTARNALQQSNIWIADDYGAGKCMASFRAFQGQVGVCTDALSWTTADITANEEWRIVRITGRNTVPGDPTTAVWKLYLNENPTALVTGNGTADRSLVDSPDWMTDGIAIGQGCYGLASIVQYDWTAVNTAGDYAPGEWTPITGTYATVSAAKADGEFKPATITGEGVISRIVLDDVGAQSGIWVQDINSVDRANILINTTDTTNVEIGNKVTGMSGMLARVDGVGTALNGATYTVTTDTASAFPLALAQKSLTHGACISTTGESLVADGTFVRIVGRITQMVDATDGSILVYVDDGSGLLDGRSDNGADAAALGVRIRVTETTGFHEGYAITDYVQIDGIAGYEWWTDTSGEAPVDKSVRAIQAASFTKIPMIPEP